MASPRLTLVRPDAADSIPTTHSPAPHATSVTISGISRIVGASPATQGGEHTVATTLQCSYKEAWERPEEPWTGKVKVPSHDVGMVQVTPVTRRDGNPTLQHLTDKKEVQVYEAKPTKEYTNLVGVRVIRAEPYGLAKVEKTVLEWPLLPSTQGETRVIKAEPLPVQPVGTRAHPAKAMPEREAFRVSKPIVVKFTEVFSVTGERALVPAGSPALGSASPTNASPTLYSPSPTRASPTLSSPSPTRASPAKAY
eukprot:EG_transcript_20128